MFIEGGKYTENGEEQNANADCGRLWAGTTTVSAYKQKLMNPHFQLVCEFPPVMGGRWHHGHIVQQQHPRHAYRHGRVRRGPACCALRPVVQQHQQDILRLHLIPVVHGICCHCVGILLLCLVLGILSPGFSCHGFNGTHQKTAQASRPNTATHYEAPQIGRRGARKSYTMRITERQGHAKVR